MSEKKNSEARIRANNRYNAKTYDRINLAVPKGHKTAIQEAANIAGQSLNGYVNQAINERIEREQEGQRYED